jgi:RimJ/RimL family protein N-acetyltransferase
MPTPGNLLVDGCLLRMRPITPEDAPRLDRAFGRLSARSVYLRFLAPIPRLAPGELTRLTTLDHDRREAIVVFDGDEMVGVARYEALPHRSPFEPRLAEVAVTIADEWQQRGLGRQLLDELADLAAARRYDALVCTILAENRGALALVRSCAPRATTSRVGNVLEVSIPLAPMRAPERAA